MVDQPAHIPIEEKHGDDCTCPPVGQINISLVAANRACPGDRNPHRAGTVTAQIEQHLPPWYPGRIVITWRSTDPRGQLATVHDADTGELLPASEIHLNVAADTRPIVAEVQLITDLEGQPLLSGSKWPPFNVTARVFRCHVAEMRTAPADPTIPTRDSVNRGEHSANQYRAHHGITDERPAAAL